MSQKEKRLRQVSYFLLKGYNESEIAKQLHVSRRTVVRDVLQLKQEADEWLDDLVDQGYIFEVKQSLDFFRRLRTELFDWKDLCECTHDEFGNLVVKELVGGEIV